MAKTLSCTIHNIRKQQDDKHLSSPFTPRRYYEGIARKSAYLKNKDLEGYLSKSALTYLDALTRTLPKDMHYRKIGQAALAKKAGCCIRKIKYGQKELQEAGIIAVKHQYKPNPRNSKRPTRKASTVWLIGLTRDELRYLDGADFDDIEPRLLLLHVKPAVRLQVLPKIPDQNTLYHDFHKCKNGDFIGANFAPYISYDRDAEVVPTFVPCTKREDHCQEHNPSTPREPSETSKNADFDSAAPPPRKESFSKPPEHSSPKASIPDPPPRNTPQDEEPSPHETAGYHADNCQLTDSSGDDVPMCWDGFARGKGWGGVSWN